MFNVFEKLEYMLMGEQPVNRFTDHRNILLVFEPVALEPNIGRHVISKFDDGKCIFPGSRFILNI